MERENKLGLTDSALAEAEERITKRRARELFDNGTLYRLEPGTVESLIAIHSALFGDVYDFAGQIRTVDIVKGNSRFAAANILPTSLQFIDIMPQKGFDDIVDKYIEAHIAHPFLFGNGRALRIWLNCIFMHKCNAVVDYSRLQKDEYRAAMRECSVDDEKLYNMLGSALTRDIGRDMYLRSVDASYAFEGYTLYRAEDV